MLYTVTCNPSLDYVIGLDALQLGAVNRCAREAIMPGGKGINVSVVLKRLGHQSRALGFLAGFTGEEIARRLNELGIEADFDTVATGMSRINVKIKAAEETEINGQGPQIAPEDVAALLARMDALEAGDILVLSGSVPASMSDDIYERIMARLDGRGVDVVVDATGDLLMRALPYRPFLIKPNNHELGELFGVELTERAAVVPYARQLQERGARNVLVSMAGAGAVLVGEDGSVHEMPAPRGTVVNSVGAGDSMVAGFLAGYLEGEGSLEQAFRMGVCTGSATAFSLGLAERPAVERLLAELDA